MTDNSHFDTLIISYNSAGEILDLLEDLRRLAPAEQVVVIDNASQDATAELVRSRFPEVMLVENPNNVGYARAVNQGFDLCSSDFVFLLNPDIRVLDPGFHPAMLDCIQQNDAIAAVGPLQFVRQGAASRLNFTWSYWTPRAFAIYLAHAFHLKRAFDTPVRTAFLNAGCLLLRKSAFLRVGKFNEKYFLYGEEPDLMLKIKRYGYECRLHPGAAVIHYRERSIGRLPGRERWKRKIQALFNISDALARGLVELLKAKFSREP